MNKRLSILLTGGAWGLILAAAIALFLLVQGDGEEEENRSALRVCSAKLHTVGEALKKYTEKNGGAFPGELEELSRTGLLSDAHAFSCPSKQFHYVYTGYSLNVKNASPDMPVAFDRINNHRGHINVLYADFRVRTVLVKEQRYSALAPLLKNLKPEEKNALVKKLERLDRIFFLKP